MKRYMQWLKLWGLESGYDATAEKGFDDLVSDTEQIARDAGIDTTQDEWWNK